MSEQTPADPHVPEHFDNPITIIEAEARFRAAGLPRHPKSIERYCRVGSLRCKKEYGANGFQYLIEPTSADELIEFLKQAHHIRNAPEHAPASSDVFRENQQANSEERGSHMLPPAPASSDASREENHTEQSGTRSGTLRYVQQLEKRLDEKDGEIGFLRSEVAVKNDQIKDLAAACDRLSFRYISDRCVICRRVAAACDRLSFRYILRATGSRRCGAAACDRLSFRYIADGHAYQHDHAAAWDRLSFRYISRG